MLKIALTLNNLETFVFVNPCVMKFFVLSELIIYGPYGSQQVFFNYVRSDCPFFNKNLFFFLTIRISFSSIWINVLLVMWVIHLLQTFGIKSSVLSRMKFWFSPYSKPVHYNAFLALLNKCRDSFVCPQSFQFIAISVNHIIQHWVYVSIKGSSETLGVIFCR